MAQQQDLPLAAALTLPNGTTLTNRLAKSALSEAMATADNRVTPALVRLYRRWAQSGIGLLVTGNVMIDRRALGEPGNVVLEDERDLAILRQWSAAAGDGTQLWMQLNHPGKQAPRGLNRETVSPSAIPFGKAMAPYFATPRALREDEIEDIIQRFGRAAAIAKKTGFGGVQIHGAHGYLVSQFLSPLHNQRQDQWGGSAENRRRFVLAVYQEIRRQVGDEFPVAIKLNSADFQRGGFSEEESLETIIALSNAGIDMVEISGGTYESPAMTGTQRKASTVSREAYFLEFSEKVRQQVSTPLMVTGGFRSQQGMNDALRSNAMDIIGMGRALAIEPDLAARLLNGQEPRYPVKPISTGISLVDKTAMMEVAWYTRQLHRMGKGRDPKPRENALTALMMLSVERGWGMFKTRRLRA